MMGSVTGAVAPAFFGMDPARTIETIADAARRELRPLGVGVSVVQAGFVSSPIIEKTAAAATTRDRGDLLAVYPALEAHAFEAQVPRERMAPAAVVADAVLDALRSPRPKIRYVVGAIPVPMPTRLLVALLHHLPAHVIDNSNKARRAGRFL